MIACPRCHAQNKPGARFCKACRQALPPTCATCGKEVKPGARFCNGCGSALPGAPSRSPTPPAPFASGPASAGTLLQGRYRIVKPLGKGGMGQVYLADDARIPGKQWAVKEMIDDPAADPADRQAALVGFEREAQLLATLDHPGLPKVTDHFDERGKHYLVMDYVQGVSLDKRLEQSPRGLPEAEVRAILGDLCEAFEYLHSRTPPVIFRDLKPANVMLQPSGKAKVIDFGTARFFKAGQTKDTHLLGTPGYAAPEQYGKQGQQSDARSDVYTLGATAHHLLSGRDPSGDPFHFPPLRALNPAVSAQMEKAVARALEQKADARWQRVSDFAAAAGCAAGGAGANAPGRSPAPVALPARTPPPAPPPTVAAGSMAAPPSPASSLPGSQLPAAGPAGSGVAAPFTFHRAPWKSALVAASATVAVALLGDIFVPYILADGVLITVMCAAYLFTHRPGAALLASAAFSGLQYLLYSSQFGYFDGVGLLILLLTPGAIFEATLAFSRWKARNPFLLWLCALAALWVAGLLGLRWGYSGFYSWLLALVGVLIVWAVSERVNRRTGVGRPEQAGVVI